MTAGTATLSKQRARPGSNSSSSWGQVALTMFRQGSPERLSSQGVPKCRKSQSSLIFLSRENDLLDGILQAHPRTPQRLHANEQPLMVEIRYDIFEPFASLANHHIKGDFDVVIIHKGRPGGCGPGYGDVSRGEALLSRDHDERELAVRFLDQRQEIVRIRPRCDPLFFVANMSATLNLNS